MENSARQSTGKPEVTTTEKGFAIGGAPYKEVTTTTTTPPTPEPPPAADSAA